MSLKIRLVAYAVVASAISAVFWYQNWQISKMQKSMQILSGNNAKLEISVERQRETVGALEIGLKEAILNSNALAEKLVDADEHRQAIIQELNSYRGRLGNAALKKPTLIEQRIDAAAADVLRQFSAETGSGQSARTD